MGLVFGNFVKFIENVNYFLRFFPSLPNFKKSFIRFSLKSFISFQEIPKKRGRALPNEKFITAVVAFLLFLGNNFFPCVELAGSRKEETQVKQSFFKREARLVRIL